MRSKNVEIPKAMFQPGDLVAGKYRILKTLGSGGMGVVYMAQHERLDRPVAIKVLTNQLDEVGGAAARFEREIRAIAMVRHPHVAHALDADVLDDGSLYLVMEYLDGRDLREERRLRGAIPYAEAVAYVVQACEGVAAVHDVGIIHRDLKPHNLFVTQLTGARCVKVFDFGISKFLGHADVTLTGHDVAVGTPLYMSPEQLRSPEKVTQLTDVWSLGVVLYELIAGVSPFEAETPGAVVAAVVIDEPVWLTDLVPDVPEALAQVIADALVKSPAKRIGSAREFAERLKPFGMRTDSIFVASSAPSERKLGVPKRPSVRPDLAARIEREVADFDSGTPDRARGGSLDELRCLPSLAKLGISRTIPASPAAQQVAAHRPEDMKRVDLAPVIVTVGPPLDSLSSDLPCADQSNAPHASGPAEATRPRLPAMSPVRSRWRNARWALGVVLTFAGLVVWAISHLSRTPGPSKPNSPVALRTDGSTLTAAISSFVAAPAPAEPSGTSMFSGSPTAKETASHTECPVPSQVGRDATQRVAPPRHKTAVPAPEPTKPPPISTAADGKPLHL